MSSTPKAFLFDLNGTMIDDMAYHVSAWHDILNQDLNAGLTQEAVKAEMYGKNQEVLQRVFGPGRFTQEEMDAISMEKEKRYQKAFYPELQLIAGLDSYLKKAIEKSLLLAIGSAAIPFNIDFVLDNLGIRRYFKAIVSAEDVTLSKPHPETFLKAAELLQVSPAECIVFEDAPKGVESAMHAGMKTIVLTTMHGKESFVDYPNILAFVEDYTDPYLEKFLG